jgi:hypothetical protein
MKYYQCLLTKCVPGGYIHTVVWLPSKWVNKKLLRLKTDEGLWNEWWNIEMIYGSQDETFISENQFNFAIIRDAKDK